MPDTPVIPLAPLVDDNNEFIRNAIPDWLINASPHRFEALKQANTEQPWLINLSVQQRQTLKTLNEASFKSQQVVDNYLATVEDLKSFAISQLKTVLKKQFNLSLDIENTYLRLYKPWKLGMFGVKVGNFQVLEISLLEAALHNFEAPEAEANAFDATSGFTQRLENPGAAPAISQALTVPSFIRLCRDLDVGASYQTHLKSILQPGDEATATRFRDAVITSQKDALKAAAYMALVKNDIRAEDHAMILEVINGERNPVLDGKPVWFNNMGMVSRTLRGCVMFAPIQKYRYADTVIVYIPHDPEHPLKRYEHFSDFEAELYRKLLARDEQPTASPTEPTRYQRFFSQFFDEADKAIFFNRFTEPAPGSQAVAEGVARSPLTHTVIQILAPTLTALLAPQELPPQKPGARVLAENPNLHVTLMAKYGLWAANVDLWTDLFEKNRDKMLNDARHRATPTLDVDARVRAQKIGQLLEGAVAIFGLVSMFVPVLGELMMAAMAGQLLYETLEGSIEWAEGDKETAKQHFLDVAQNLAVMALLAGAGKGLQKLATPAAPELIQTLKPIKLPNGEQRLWKPDLAPYRSDIVLPKDAVFDDLGLHSHDEQPLLALDDQLYALKPDPNNNTYRIQHPTRPDAYAPEVAHNGAGTWIHEGEEPLTWQGPTLMRRLGYRTHDLSDTQLEQVRVSSGVTPEQLRQLHADNEQPPALLEDSLERSRINQRIDRFIEHMSSDDPFVYAQAEQAMTDRVIAQKGLNYEALPGSTPEELAEQAMHWRRSIARAAQDNRTSLFDQDYRAYDVTQSPAVQQLRDRFSGLPASVAEQLLASASPAETLAFSQHKSLSPRLAALARESQQEVRLQRAYEGLFVDAQETHDSRRLALHTLETLPGWPAGLPVEIRQGSASGPLIDAIGTPSEIPTTVLAVDEDGTFGETDLYGAVLARLNQGQRRTLGEVALDADTLKQRVRQTPLPWETLRPVLLEYPVFRKPLEGSLRLRGGAPLFNFKSLLSSSTRVRKLYPSFTDEQISVFMDTYASDLSGELKRREAQYATLKQDLNGWVERSVREEKARNPTEQNPGARERAAAATLKSCWRRQLADRSGNNTGRLLKIESAVTLPHLSASFAHVEELLLNYVSFTNTPQQFLSSFPNLKRLTLKHVGGIELRTLTQLPEAITDLKELTQLDLSGNAIALDETSAERLAGLTHLEQLTLDDNPLGAQLEFGSMPRLRRLSLNRTGLEQWPSGLLIWQELRLVDLTGNRLTEVPDSLLNPAPTSVEASIRLNRVTRLHHNPFTARACQQMRAYLDRMAQTRAGWRNEGLPGAFEVPLSNDPHVVRVRALLPGFSEAENEHFVLRAGARAEVEVTRLEAQWQTLDASLDTWAAQPFMLEAGEDHVRLGDANERQRFADALKQCWKRLTPKALARDGTPIGYKLEVDGLRIGELPELEADFSHVGSIKLWGMQPLNGADGFLAHFSRVRWLELSRCDLRSLPPSLSAMSGLTRLTLEGNQLALSEADVAVLEGLTTLKTLNLNGNPLVRLPNFNALRELRGLQLQNTGIDQWPQGLGEQPGLELVDLRDNQITDLPPSQINPTAEQAASAIRVNNVTYIQGNPLTFQAQGQLDEYWLTVVARYPQATAARRPGTMRYLAPEPAAAAGPEWVQVGDAPEPAFLHWTTGLPPAQVARAQTLWESIAAKPGSQPFLKILNNLKRSAEYRGGYANLRARVWSLIDAAQDEGLREELFAAAGDPRCGDRAALVFSDMETKMMVWQATRMAPTAESGPPLMNLARGLFRLDEVEKVASEHIRAEEVAIRSSNLPDVEKRAQIHQLEDIEIRLAYRMGLSERLDLPGQPRDASYLATGGVTQSMLDIAGSRIERMDNTPPYLQSLLGREFWQDFIQNHYAEQFQTLREPFDLRMQELFEQQAAGTLSDEQYTVQAEEVQLQRSVKQAELIESLTLKDWVGQLQRCEGEGGCSIV